MTRQKKDATPAQSDLKVTPEVAKIIPQSEIKDSDPVNLEIAPPSDEPVPAPEATSVEKIQTDIRAKLSKKTDAEDVFVPSNPVALEKAAEQVAKEAGFSLNRGTSIGARLMARSRKMA
jgi:hypothetical protein